MAQINYLDYVKGDTVVNGFPIDRYVGLDAQGLPVDSMAVAYTPEGYLVVNTNDAKLYKQDHPEGKPYVTKNYSELERQKMFNDYFGKSKIDDVEQKENGGILSQAPKELVDLVQAAMSDESAAKKLSLLKSQRPDLADMIEQIAAELQGAQSMKCGGSVKKKQMGDKINRKKMMAKGGCPCMIKKVGGLLIEVDSCTGLPVHRNGGQIKKYQNIPTAVLTQELLSATAFKTGGELNYANYLN